MMEDMLCEIKQQKKNRFQPQIVTIKSKNWTLDEENETNTVHGENIAKIVLSQNYWKGSGDVKRWNMQGLNNLRHLKTARCHRWNVWTLLNTAAEKYGT